MTRLVVSLLAAMVVSFAATAQDWSTVTTPAPGPPQSIGFYSAGCIQGAQAMPFDGPGYEVIRLSRNRYWGQPSILNFIQVLAQQVRAASHQTGLDADIWFERQPGPPRPPEQREQPRLRSLVNADDTGIDDSVFTPQHVSLLRMAAEMPDLDRMFVNKFIKQRL